jgi:hypothetical protein
VTGGKIDEIRPLGLMLIGPLIINQHYTITSTLVYMIVAIIY